MTGNEEEEIVRADRDPPPFGLQELHEGIIVLGGEFLHENFQLCRALLGRLGPLFRFGHPLLGDLRFFPGFTKFFSGVSGPSLGVLKFSENDRDFLLGLFEVVFGDGGFVFAFLKGNLDF